MKTQSILTVAGCCLGLLLFSCTPTQVFSVYPENDFSATTESLETNAAALKTILREHNFQVEKANELLDDILAQSRQLQEANPFSGQWGKTLYQQYVEARCRRNCPPGPLPCDVVGSCPEMEWKGKFSFLLPEIYRNARIRVEQGDRVIAESVSGTKSYAPGIIAIPVERRSGVDLNGSTATVHILPEEGTSLREEISFEMQVRPQR